jgi:hypothetical protein
LFVIFSESAFKKVIKLPPKLIENQNSIWNVARDFCPDFCFHEVGNRFSAANKACSAI